MNPAKIFSEFFSEGTLPGSFLGGFIWEVWVGAGRKPAFQGAIREPSGYHRPFTADKPNIRLLGLRPNGRLLGGSCVDKARERFYDIFMIYRYYFGFVAKILYICDKITSRFKCNLLKIK